MIGPILGGMARLKFDASVNIVCDGNSLTAGVGGYPWPNGLKTRTGFTTCTITGLGVSGQTTRQMNGLDGQPSSDVDGAFVAGKTNVLVAWEGTNSICNVNRTAAQAAQDMADYIAARQAYVAANRPGERPWIVLIGTCLPRQTALGQAQTTAQNADPLLGLDAYNALLRANYRSMGAKGLFDVRQAGSPFNIADYNYATFEALATSSGLWSTTDAANDHIHLRGAGYDVLIDQFIAPALKRLPAR